MKSGNLLKIISTLAAVLLSSNSAAQATDSLSYTEDILPLFSTTCLDCHGPDETRRMMNLRLDTQDFLSSHIVPGNPNESLIYQRITHGDAVRKMPPVSSGRSLTDDQIETVRSWIISGAEWGVDLSAAEQADLLLVAERQINFTREVRPILSRN